MKDKENVVTEVAPLDLEKLDAALLRSSSVPSDTPEKPHMSRWEHFKDGFRRFDEEDAGIDPNLPEHERIAQMTAKSTLNRLLKNRHLQMIAIGGSIGTGLFVGLGKSLHNGGPAGLVLAYILVGIMIYCTVQSLGELCVTFPVSGAFTTYNSRFIDPSWGFAMAWNYALQWLIVMPLELVAASMTIRYWDTETNPAAYVTIMWVLIAAINFFGVKGYGEAEFIFSAIKVIAVIGFFILSLVIIGGGGPTGEKLGSRYWHNPGAWANGFKGLLSVFVVAAFAFTGTELVGLAAAESANPRATMPRAIKQVFWRITLFYVISLVMVSCLVPYNDPRLLGSSSVDASASPFVLAIVNAHISGLDLVMNVVIMISVLSVGNSAVFGSSRTLCALAAAGQAPKILSYIDKRGRPLVAVIVQLTFGFLCYLAAYPDQGTVFTWMLALSGLSSIFTWGSINVAHIRFRLALRSQNRGTDELTWTSQPGIIGSIVGCTMNVLILVAQLYVAVRPLGGDPPSAEAFFQSCLSIPVILAFYIVHKVWKRNWRFWIPLKEIDIDTGRRETDLELVKQEIAEEKAAIKAMPWWKRIYKWWC